MSKYNTAFSSNALHWLYLPLFRFWKKPFLYDVTLNCSCIVLWYWRPNFSTEDNWLGLIAFLCTWFALACKEVRSQLQSFIFYFFFRLKSKYAFKKSMFTWDRLRNECTDKERKIERKKDIKKDRDAVELHMSLHV